MDGDSRGEPQTEDVVALYDAMQRQREVLIDAWRQMEANDEALLNAPPIFQEQDAEVLVLEGTLREPTAEAVLFANPRKRIIVFGDDITEEAHATWAGTISSKLARRCDLIIRGFSGYNTSSGLAGLKAMLEVP